MIELDRNAMHPSLQYITQLPLAELFDGSGPLPYRRVRDVHTDDIREMLRSGPVQFMIANLGSPPEVIPLARTFDFWKSEVLSHLTGPDEVVRREQFPGEYFYWASEWNASSGPRIVLLEKCH